MYLYSAMADVAAMTGDSSYISAMNCLWDDVINHKMYITGGIGVREHNEGFAKAYYLPNKDAYAETCASIGLALWSHRLTLLHKNAEYFDIFERVLYNGLLSGVSLDGTKFFYENPLEADGKFAFNEGQVQRSAWFDCSCCPTNVVRFLPSISGYVYAYDSNGIYANMYVTNDAIIDWRGQKISIKQTTRYPWDGHVKFELEPERKSQFDLALRIPGWAGEKPVPGDLYQFMHPRASGHEKIQISVNGDVQSLKVINGYVHLERTWMSGDVVELILPMPVRKVTTHPAVEFNKHKVALQRGPVIYCLEEPDNGPGVRNMALADENNFTAVYEDNLLGGVMTIQGRAMNRKMGEQRPHAFVAIPYYSWANREPGQMLVWIPETDI